jgi:hypothetical protein
LVGYVLDAEIAATPAGNEPLQLADDEHVATLCATTHEGLPPEDRSSGVNADTILKAELLG